MFQYFLQLFKPKPTIPPESICTCGHPKSMHYVWGCDYGIDSQRDIICWCFEFKERDNI